MSFQLLVIHTGGTISMEKGTDGWQANNRSLDKHLSRLCPNSITYKLINIDPAIDSSCANYQQWYDISKLIIEHQQYDGFLVLHGTDTMSYGASAVRFFIKQLNKPIIFTGSQVPLCVKPNDADNNLSHSFANIQLALKGVWLQFNGELFKAEQCSKQHAHDYQAFKQPFNSPLTNEQMQKKGTPSKPTQPLTASQLRTWYKPEIATYTITPGDNFKGLAALINLTPDFLILKTYGLGNAPANETLFKTLKQFHKNGGQTINISQCFSSIVDMQQYQAGSKLYELCVQSGKGITLEAAMAKCQVLGEQDFSKSWYEEFYEQH